MTSNSTSPITRTHRFAATVSVAVSLTMAVALLVVGMPAPAAPAAVNEPARKVESALLADLDDGGKQAFVIEFSDSADLSGASRIQDWTERGQAVVDVLRRTAVESQAGVLGSLRAQGADYTSFWINNTVYVEAGSRRMALQVAQDAAVTTVRAAESLPLEKPVEADAPRSAAGTEWGIADIKADRVWEEYDDRGQGIVVANIDSGAQFDHPALVASYRGTLADGAFDHNYNWWDPSLACAPVSLEPCDNVGHGSHTMGTMVGDGGAGNKIGVAPGARWMAAKGCEFAYCTEFGLTASAQWILEPTDLNGENPDVSMRPHVVNNSWSWSGQDDWYQGFVRAWVASGIFPVFSNGNAGPDCDTTGSPGAYVQSYSVGNYTPDGTIADTSSRGPGVSHETKPNISAPGTAVRSSVPEDGYDVYSGTSMAAPHLAGTVALMWSAAPSLIGDVDATRHLLDDTARDESDFQCGGSADDNNVYGEGRLDALAVVSAAPRGEVGTLEGTITERATGEPVGGARLELSGASSRSVMTAADGRYSITLTPGTYAVHVTSYGYGDEHVDGVVVTRGQSTTSDLTLARSELVTLQGSVRDGSGHGWPVYASVVLPGTSSGTFTDPATGRYSLDVPAGTYEIRVEPEYPGYVTQFEEVTVDGDTTHDWHLEVDGATCTAPGYRRGPGLRQAFDAKRSPAGWTVVDDADNGQAWTFDDPGARGNLTGAAGGFAIIDSDEYGEDGTQDSSLVSPKIDLGMADHPVVEFATDFKAYYWEHADVDVSIDDGRTWSNSWRSEAGSAVRGPSKVRVELPEAAHEPDVRVRFRYDGSDQGWWWQVDDVFVGEQSCIKQSGGLVLGQTTSPITGKPVVGAEIAATRAPAERATTVGTPLDDALEDGFYWLFSPAGRHTFIARADGHSPDIERVSARPDRTTREDFELGTGRLAPRAAVVSGSVRLGHKVTERLTIVNTGDGGARYALEDLGRNPERPDASTVTDGDAPRATLSVPGHWSDIAPYPTPIKDSAAGFHDGLVYSFGGTVGGVPSGGEAGGAPLKKSYRYDPAASAWERIADLPDAREKPSGAFIGGRFIVTGGWGEDDFTPVAATSIYDPETDSWSVGAPNPSPWAASGTAVLDGDMYVVGGCAPRECGNQDVLRYDPATDTWTRLADYPQNTAWVSCGGIHGKVYCAGGIGEDADSLSTYSYSPRTDTWRPVADMPEDMWASAYSVSSGRLVVAGGSNNHSENITAEAFAYDPLNDSWSPLPEANYELYRSAGACGFFKIGGAEGYSFGNPAAEQLPGLTDCSPSMDTPWLTLQPVDGALRPGRSQTVKITLDARRVREPGVYTATLRLDDDTPFARSTIRVRMYVKRRRGGWLAGPRVDAGVHSRAEVRGGPVVGRSWSRSR